MSFDRTAPYNSLPFLPPNVDIESKAILKKVIAATRALGELKGMGDIIPNQSVLLSTLALQEAKSSSEIENVVTTNDELYRAFADESQSLNPSTKEVLRYNSALWHGYEHLQNQRPLTTTLFENLVSIIKEQDIRVRTLQGTRIAAGRETIYTPPEGENLLRSLLYDLEKFVYDDSDLDPLIKLAVMHYQFEAIHPFGDGNGRTGRILNILYLVEAKLLDFPILYMSRYIIDHKSDYYDLLRRVTEEGAWEQWILYILTAIEQTALETKERIVMIRDLMNDISQQVKDQLPAIYSKDLIEVLFTQPYCKIKFLQVAGIAARQTASKYLQSLEKIRVLQSHRVGKEIYYMNTAFFALLAQ